MKLGRKIKRKAKHVKTRVLVRLGKEPAHSYFSYAKKGLRVLIQGCETCESWGIAIFHEPAFAWKAHCAWENAETEEDARAAAQNMPDGVAFVLGPFEAWDDADWVMNAAGGFLREQGFIPEADALRVLGASLGE